MSKDIIYREDAIKAINSVGWLEDAEYEEKILAVPTIKPKRGEWIDISEWYTPRQKCSICETVVDGYGSNFCPNCGADMRGAGDD